MTHDEKLDLARKRYGKAFAHEKKVDRRVPKSEWLRKQELSTSALSVVRGKVKNA